MTSEELAAVWSTMPFAHTIGAELLEAEAAGVRARVHWDALRCTVAGVLHGGRSTPLHTGRRFIVVETELHDDAGRLVAKVTQTQAVL